MFTKQLLPNDLTLLTIQMPGTQAVTVLVMVKVGSRNETAPLRGISHFLEHMPFKGTQKYPTAFILSSVVDGVGAQFNAFTGKEYTGFWVKSAAKHLELALDILSQLLFHPLLPPAEIEKEKGVIIEEINMYEDQPMVKVGLDFETLLYGNTPLGWETIGTKQTVKSIKKEDFINHINNWYRPENIVVGLAGAVGKVSRIKDQVLKYFGSCQQKARPHSEEKLVFTQHRPEINVRYKKTEQAHLCLGVRAYPRAHKNRYSLVVLATMLGGNMSSRLFMQVREKRGLAYYIRTQPEAYLDNGYLVTQAGTNINKAFEAIRVILSEYQKTCRTGGISAKELTKAKEFLKGRLILGLEDSQEMDELYTEDYLLENRVRTAEEIIKNIDQVSAESVIRVAREIFAPYNLNLSIIGPFKDDGRQKFEKILE
jgi:predicted Zn-dependent peptidase